MTHNRFVHQPCGMTRVIWFMISLRAEHPPCMMYSSCGKTAVFPACDDNRHRRRSGPSCANAWSVVGLSITRPGISHRDVSEPASEESGPASVAETLGVETRREPAGGNRRWAIN